MTTIEDAQFVEVTEKIPDSSSEVMVLDSEVIESEEIPEDSNIMIIDESYFVFSNGDGGGNSEDNQDQNSDQDSDKNQDNSNDPDDQGQTQDCEDSNGESSDYYFNDEEDDYYFNDEDSENCELFDSDTEGDPYFDVNHDLDDKESEFIQVLKKDRTLVS